MEVETRLLEEWKANNELLKFYEDLKQKRFAHFLTIQTAFLAFFALLAKDALVNISMVSLTALVLIAIPPLIIAFYFQRVERGLARFRCTFAVDFRTRRLGISAPVAALRDRLDRAVERRAMAFEKGVRHRVLLSDSLAIKL